VILKLYNNPKVIYPTKVKAITILNIISFHHEVPFFYASLSTIYATPTPNPVPLTIHIKSKIPTCTGVKIYKN